ncbi:unnamed protein product [Schistocephalus solidus]|uniref:Uncharacterized protein n=1 Tax=Schistocephalus solidus TaxID=70667 RepID=A0A183T1N7_SCHSO|nr:unnamed protein product [Schistocephalus solidus]
MKLGVQSKGRHRSGSSVSSETAGSVVSGTQSGPMAVAGVREVTPPFPVFSTSSGLSPVGLGPYARKSGNVGYFQQLAQHQSHLQRQKGLPEANSISPLPTRLGQQVAMTRPCRKLASSVTDPKFNSLRAKSPDSWVLSMPLLVFVLSGGISHVMVTLRVLAFSKSGLEQFETLARTFNLIQWAEVAPVIKRCLELGGGSVALDNLTRLSSQTTFAGKIAQPRQSPQRLFSSQSAAARLSRSTQQQQHHHQQQQQQPSQQPPPPPVSAWWPILGVPAAPEVQQQQPMTSAPALENSGSSQVTEDMGPLGDQHHQQQGLLASLVPETLRTMLTVNTGTCDGGGASSGLSSDRELFSEESKMAPLSQFHEDVLLHYRRIQYSHLGGQPSEAAPSVGGYLSKRDSGLFEDITDALSGLGGLSDSSEGCYGGFTSPLCSPPLCCAPSSGLAEDIVTTAAATGAMSNSSAPVSIPGRCLRRAAQRKFDAVAVTVATTGLSSTTSGSSTATVASSNTTADTSLDSAFHSATTSAVCGGGGAFVAADAVPSSSASSLLATAGVTAAGDSVSPTSEHDSALVLSEGGGRPVRDFTAEGGGLLTHAAGEAVDFPASCGDHNSGGKLSSQHQHYPHNAPVAFGRCVGGFPAGFNERSPSSSSCRLPGSNVELLSACGGGGASSSSVTSSSFTNLPQSPVLISSPFSNPGCDLERLALRRELEDALSKLKEGIASAFLHSGAFKKAALWQRGG